MPCGITTIYIILRSRAKVKTFLKIFALKRNFVSFIQFKEVFFVFYDNLKSLCDSKGIKITTVVTECGGALGSISKWRNGANPNSDIVIKLSLHLGVTTDYLLLGKSIGNSELTNDEQELLENYRKLDDGRKKEISEKIKEQNDSIKDEVYTELSKIITSLPLRERSKLIAMIYDCDEQYRKYGSMQMPQATDLPVSERQLLDVFRQFNDYEQAKVLERIKEWLDVKHRREHTNSQRTAETQTPKPEFSAQTRIVARSFDGTYESRLATPEELEKMKLLKDAPEPEY